MSNNFVRDGKTFLYTNSGGTTLAAGTPVIFDGVSRLGVIVADIAASATGEVDTEGVFTLTKKTAGDNFTLGLANFKLDSSNLLVLNAGTGSPDTAISNAYVYEASASATTVKVKLLG